MSCIYLDHNATTPVDPRVLESMLPYFSREFGNASSRGHEFGWRAKEAVEAARAQVARCLGVSNRDVLFTSGATEADNIAIVGLVEKARAQNGGKPVHVVSQATEHPAVLDPLAALEKRGDSVTLLPVDRSGRVDPDAVRNAIRPETVLVTIMAANNELGTVEPVAEIAAVCREAGVRFHTDAAQAVGKIPIDAREWEFDLLSLSGHKFYAPKGVGALVVCSRSPRIRLDPVVRGGGQERGIRPGTLNVPGIVGLGEAARIAAEDLAGEGPRIAHQRDRLEAGIRAALDGVTVNGPSSGDAVERVPGTTNLSFDGVDGNALLVGLKEIAVSSGSACASGNTDVSHVLKAIGVSPERALASVRISVGRGTTDAEIEHAIAHVETVVRELRRR